MKLIEIWKRLGRQPLKNIQRKEAVVFVNDEEYTISKIRYDSGKIIGFEAKPRQQKWFSEELKPEEDKKVVVRGVDGKEYPDHQWIGHAWYEFCRNNDDTCGIRRTLVDVTSWRYQEV